MSSAAAATGAARAAWSSATAATVLGAVGVALDMVLGRNVPGMADGPALVSVAGSAALLAFLSYRSARPTERLASIVFLLNAGLISFAMYLRDPHYAQLAHWVPFQSTKVACIAAAMLAPQLWSAFVGIGIHAGSALLVLAKLDPRLRETIALEPLATLAFALIGSVLAFDRHRRLSLERQVAMARADAVAAEHLARTILAIRELANTPIQTIEFCNELLRTTEESAHPAILERIDRSTARLREVSQLLREYESSARWGSDDAAMNARRVLEEGADRVRRTTLGRS